MGTDSRLPIYGRRLLPRPVPPVEMNVSMFVAERRRSVRQALKLSVHFFDDRVPDPVKVVPEKGLGQDEPVVWASRAAHPPVPVIL